MPALPTGNELLRTRNPGIESRVFGEALVDHVEIDAGIHEPRIMPTEDDRLRAVPGCVRLALRALVQRIKISSTAADTGSANCLFSKHSMNEGRENASTARF